MSGKLYLCATPIGNLEDITLRVLRTLKEVDLIAAEDTRNSIKLLNHFDIKTPMTSYHEYNKIDKAYVLINKMREGQNIALITDAQALRGFQILERNWLLCAVKQELKLLLFRDRQHVSQHLHYQACLPGVLHLKLFCRQIRKRER